MEQIYITAICSLVFATFIGGLAVILIYMEKWQKDKRHKDKKYVKKEIAILQTKIDALIVEREFLEEYLNDD